MHKKFFNALYVLNIVSQAIITLLIPPALLSLLTYLAVSRLGAPSWLYAVSIVVGFITGFISMIKFVLTSMAGLERLEKEQTQSRQEKENKDK